MATPQESFEDEKETKILIDNSDFKEEMLKEAASEALTKNIINLKKAISGNAFQDIVLACEQKELIQSSLKRNLLDTSSGRTIDVKATELVSEMQSIVGFRPDRLDTFLCVLTQHGGIPGKSVAEAIAKDYGYTLPNYMYERSSPVANANHTYHLSTEDEKTTYSTTKMVVFGCIVLTLLIIACTCTCHMYMYHKGSEIKITTDDKETMTKPTQQGSVLLSLRVPRPLANVQQTVTCGLMSDRKYFHKRKDEL